MVFFFFFDGGELLLWLWVMDTEYSALSSGDQAAQYTEPPTSSQCSLSATPMPLPGFSDISFMESLELKREMADGFWKGSSPLRLQH